MEKRLPDGWEWTKLSKICEKSQYGYTTSAKHDGIPPHLLRTTDISNGEINWGSVPFCSEPPIDEERYLLKEGDILIARAGSVGASIVVRNPPESIFASYLIRFRPKENLNPRYAGFFLRSNMFWAQLGSKTAGTTLPGVNATNLSNVKIPLPPLETQRKIVAILEKAEETKRLRMQADELANQLLQSVFLEMFGDPVKNPKRWEMVKLGDFGDWTSGGTPSRTKPEYFQGNIPWFTAGELNDSYLLNSKERITEEALEVSAAKIFPKETMLIGMYDSAAFKMGLLLQPASSNQACAAFIPKKEELDSLFALHLFKAMKPVFLSKRRGVRQKNLSQSIIKNFEVPLPPFSLQMEFRQIVETIEKMRQNQKQSQQEIDNLFNALMQKAFKGELTT